MTTTAKLLREYRCKHCGGRLVEKYIDDERRVVCGRCSRSDFIHEHEHQRQQADAQEVLEGLPAEMQGLFGYERPAPVAEVNNVLHPVIVEI